MKQVKCVVCEKAIKESRAGRKKFCSDACRAFQWRTGQAAIPCHYCGCPADTTDHIPPRSVRQVIFNHGLQDKFPSLEVNCCKECNTLLGYRDLWTLAKRKKFLRRALRLRYRRLLRLPKWTDEQLKELGRDLRSFVQAGIIAREVLIERLKY